MKNSIIHVIIFISIFNFPYVVCQTNEGLNFTFSHGAVIRGDSTKKEIALVFTGDSFADGADHITKVLRDQDVKASFFFTGNFYRNENFKSSIENLKADNHYLGAHSDKHLLYCDWEKRDSTLVTKEEFTTDLLKNYYEMERFGISFNEAEYFLPPFEWYNDTISTWTKELGLTLFNFTPGIKSNADYTTPGMKNYISSEDIHKNIFNYEKNNRNGLNGYILLIHFGTAPERTDKYYFYLDNLIKELKILGYSFKRIDELIALVIDNRH